MKRLGIICLFFLTIQVFASQSLMTKVIQLQYISATQAMQLMNALMQPGEQLSGSGHTLVAKVSPQTLTHIREVLHQVDVPPVTFNISVYQGDPQWLSSQNNNSVTYSTQTQSQMLQNQSVRVMSGNSALVTLDQEAPIVTSIGGFYSGVTYEQHQVKNGMLVHPVLRGKQVQLTIRRLREQNNPAGGQQFDNQKMETTVMVPLNKWVSLGTTMGAEETDNSSTSYSAGNTFATQSTLYIRVSIVGGGGAAAGENPGPRARPGSQDVW